MLLLSTEAPATVRNLKKITKNEIVSGKRSLVTSCDGGIDRQGLERAGRALKQIVMEAILDAEGTPKTLLLEGNFKFQTAALEFEIRLKPI